ncbi:unnamed protein product [Rotaria sp. Silwood1]|nr:unnamed protein product [Rotaria sp. Silwood1]CAF3598057.1 unnamed protein product [Rotaria sp. Silwood1]CAF4886776.1 unnamed protein product [Rotaria sp. Silwood1]
MTFFPIHRYRLFDDPVDRFFDDQLDFFDPCNQSNQSKSLIPTLRSPNPEKYCVQFNVAGFNPETIKTKVQGRKVIVEAKQEDRQPDDSKHLASYVTPNNILVIEVAIHNPEIERRVAQAKNDNQSLAQFGQYRDPLFDYIEFLVGSDFQPRIIDKGNNQKQLEISIEMKNSRSDEIKVSVQNNELIVQDEHQHKDKNCSERSFFFKSTTLPPGTQMDQLQSHLTDDRQLKIEAPYIEQNETTKSIEHQKK